MVVGLLQLELHLPTCNSLKDKRSILKRLINHLRRTYNVAVAETDHNDVWRSAQIGVVTVFNDLRLVENTLSKVASEVVNTDGVELIDQQIEIL